ncbi:MAG: 2-amino-4-hydroxy-6-hydroxymethyldihydropteridine diphosphokinase [Epsilonproteobacteria bacterium]|nr:2-amino-4-hydroxy-6-hydroxymethyldihydropteridine diphosphokinase [Campylobacterota bacterium]
MKKKLSSELTLYFEGLFPKKFNKEFPNAIVGIGGNVGDVKKRFKKVALLLKDHPQVQLIATAPILKNPPFGYLNQPYFFNSVLAIKTSFSPKELLFFLLSLEHRFKRKRIFKNAPRTLDLDILFYENIHYNTQELTIPHPAWSQRDSVKIPLRFLLELL